ncbi:uncharacterized protein LOC109598448 isoform X2 [Aethina tumida]|uniref:uncharacterized protein LOC109598448 isoform X2 n=1 Tax=Aethina tumida TaxID=116153 RepID=UPI002148E000|nr:uncharacterized protein LOC109598448 isoform X2 [Aethina tumida]
MRHRNFQIGVLCVQLLCVLCQDKTTTGPSQNAIKTSEKTTPIPSLKYVKPEIKEIKPVEKKTDKEPKLICPGKDVPRPFFALPCTITKDCGVLGKNLLCCDKRCRKGVPPPQEEIKHEPIFFGLVDRKCPMDPIAEIFQIKQCEKDDDCLPRICCPEKLRSGEIVGYCRTAEPIWDKMPIAKQLTEPIRTLVSYMQCTPPPPPILDVFPKPCDNGLDCFPNLCCQEGGKRFCRPPKRSILALVAGIGQRVIPSEAARAFIERIS